jgi:hypothetical protein
MVIVYSIARPGPEILGVAIGGTHGRYRRGESPSK